MALSICDNRSSTKHDGDQHDSTPKYHHVPVPGSPGAKRRTESEGTFKKNKQTRAREDLIERLAQVELKPMNPSQPNAAEVHSEELKRAQRLKPHLCCDKCPFGVTTVPSVTRKTGGVVQIARTRVEAKSGALA